MDSGEAIEVEGTAIVIVDFDHIGIITFAKKHLPAVIKARIIRYDVPARNLGAGSVS